MAAPVQAPQCRAHYTAAVGASVVAFSNIVTNPAHRAKVTKCTLQALGAPVAFRYDIGGGVVSASNGFILADGGFYLLDQGNDTINALQFIRAASSTATLIIALEWTGQ